MASSDLTKQAQTVKICELCEEENSKWRCMECNMSLCGKCKTIHLKIPAAAHHQIVTIGTPLKDVQRKIFTDDIHCEEHPEEKIILFCRSCKSLICQDCVATSHTKHNFDSIKSALDEKLNYLKVIQTKIDDNMKCCESMPSEVENTKSKFNTIFDESLTKIKRREQELVDEIRKYSQLLQENVENEREEVNNTLMNIEKDINNKRENLGNQKDEINTIIMSSQGGVIFKANMLIKDIEFDPFPDKADDFIPGKTSIKQIQEMFGLLEKVSVSTTHDPQEIELEVINTLTTDLPYIDLVEPLDETTAWISCFEKTVRKLNIKDNNMITSKYLSIKVIDMTSTFNGELLLTGVKYSEVKLLKHSGEIASFLSVAPLYPRGIHVTKDNNFIVGVKEPGNMYTPTDQSQRAVVVYGMDGKQKHKYQYDMEGQRLFTLPESIITNSQQGILAVDKTSGRTGRVVSINKDGDLQWIYEGHSKINAGKKFDPSAIAATSMDSFLVSDYSSHALHVLSDKGEVLTYKVLSDMEIKWPWGLGINNKGMLWLGCGTGGEKTGAKLHIIKL